MTKFLDLLDKQIKKAYARKGMHWYNLPFYLSFGKYELCVYAMNLDWKSLRIKIEKDCQIVAVIKKGIY